MRERVGYLIDQKVERRVREFMDEFRQEIYSELAEQRKQNEEHIQYYAQQKLGPLPAQKQFIPTTVVPSTRPMVKSGAPPQQFIAQPMSGTMKPAAYSKSPQRTTVMQAPMAGVGHQPLYNPPQYAVKSTPSYTAMPQQQNFGPPYAANSATKQQAAPYRKSSGISPTANAKGFRAPPMSAGQARTGYMPQGRVSGGFNKGGAAF